MKAFVRKIDKVGEENKPFAALHVSLDRLLAQSTHHDHYKQLLILLTMFNESNLTKELLISCAEVIMTADKQVQVSVNTHPPCYAVSSKKIRLFGAFLLSGF